jgi:hypothetical protein
MTTPASGQISLGDLKSELSLIGGPSSNIKLARCNDNIMADGFWDTYSYKPITGGGEVPLSNFYNLQTPCAYTFKILSSVTNYNDFTSRLLNLSQAGGNSGPNAQPTTYDNPTSGSISPGTTNGINIVHMQGLDVNVSCRNNSPIPPFANIYMEYDYGTGGTVSFAGSPFNGPTVNVNGGPAVNVPNDTSTPNFGVNCYQ